MLHLYCFTLWIVFLKYVFLQTVTAEQTETDHKPPRTPKGCCPRFSHVENILGFSVNISQKALNKSHHVAGFCAAALALAAQWSEELTCRADSRILHVSSTSKCFAFNPNYRSEPKSNLPPRCLCFLLEFDVFTTLFYFRPKGATL